MRFIVFCLGAFLANQTLNAQHIHDPRTCGAHDHYLEMLQNSPEARAKVLEIERHTEAFIQSGQTSNRAVITIPVVVHVLYNTTVQNISDAQIQTQIDVLNADFRKLNADKSKIPAAFSGLAADSEIQFCLAKRDPNGLATTGIQRKSTTVTSFSTNDAMKKASTGGLDAWSSSSYLNLWVCNLGSSLLGYAQFPGGTAATDGVVVNYTAFGTTGTAQSPFNLGRTATHEVGHWLNLRHIWGDANCGSDLVTDTPTQQTSNYSCPTFPRVTCSNGPNGDMFMNYMDYVDDACMYMFSAGQKARMQALFATGGSRASLATSLGCVAPTTPTTCSTPTGISAGSISNSSAVISWAAVAGATNYTLQYKTAAATTWTSVTVTGTTQTLTGLTASTTYNYQVRTNCGTTASALSTSANFSTTAAPTTCTDAYESNNTTSAAKTIAVNTNIRALISTSTDVDYFKFSNTSTNKNIRITLTNLPADYDVKVYRGTTLVATSAQTGTTSESIILNNATVTSYTVYVYGYNKANNATSCYTLNASISSVAFRTDGSENQVDASKSDLEKFSTDLFVSPNPVRGLATIEMFADATQEVQLAIFDLTGKQVSNRIEVLNEGRNLLTQDFSQFTAGVYLVRSIRDGEVKIARVIVE